MQTTDSQFTAEQKSSTRSIAKSLQVSWKREDLSGAEHFTIGVSTIGGMDSIPSATGINSRWQNYRYFDESQYVLDMEWERKLNFPLGGIVTALASGTLDNTSGRFLPDYAGGESELFTSVLPRRPVVINAGFEYGGTDHMIPQYVGVFSKQPEVNKRNATMRWQAYDFMDYLANKKVDQTVMFTSQRSDVIIANSLERLGFATAQYELDEGRQTIAFGIFDKGTTWFNYINQIVQAEQGHLYQDEEGILRFENRVHWDSAPVIRTIHTSEVIEELVSSDDKIVNQVEINAKVRAKQPNQLVYEIATPIELQAQADTEFFVDFEDPMLSIDTPTYVANSQDNGEGTDESGSVSIKSVDKFARSAKYVFTNSSVNTLYITELTIDGRPAKVSEEVYVIDKIDSSITAFDERTMTIENDYIQSEFQAQTLAATILQDYATPSNLLEITIKAQPDLQLGDRISWSGQSWNIFGIATQLDPSMGFLQTLSLIQRNELSLFTIGVSVIEGADIIAP